MGSGAASRGKTCRIAELDTADFVERQCCQTSCGLEACNVPYGQSFPPEGSKRCAGCGLPWAKERSSEPFFRSPCCGRYPGYTGHLPENPRPKLQRSYAAAAESDTRI
eukprot:gnl/TRDRNA2_/TRDRNA2_124136_c0_seq1.p1 gnl/TRDRNA2_/TRDRNA2_124136_c0~~gnl/TRDRNA2_/TRDRNA2_124136_c0_seq1.p1  ORF type:complete len:108 (-),score=9.40 gnl/TRDRNA2_/TRDRNA2_124136_c0_seq1:162-485(-)